MGKTKRKKGQQGGDRLPMQSNLGDQIEKAELVESSERIKRKRANFGELDEEVVDADLTRKILDQAKKQRQEAAPEDELRFQRKKEKETHRPTITLRKDGDSSDEDKEASDDDEEIQHTAYNENEIVIDESEEKILEEFMSDAPKQRRTLADIFKDKLTEKQTELSTKLSENQSSTGDGAVVMRQMDERVVKMYKQIGVILTKYRSGKIPKAFKVVPALSNWEQILFILEPERWSAAAMYQATRMFTANLKARMAQRFFNLVLLPRIRDDIAEYKRLNFHLYQALRKTLFKSAAFFKGILIPLCESGNCTLREAVIISSVLAKNSIPMLHSAAALLKIAEMDYNGANSIFIRTLIDKKYALPYRVVDALVAHFLRFAVDKRELPVLWHQSLLAFVQRYKEDISDEQKEALLELLKNQSHYQITPEIRRELLHATTTCRGVQGTQAASSKMDVN